MDSGTSSPAKLSSVIVSGADDVGLVHSIVENLLDAPPSSEEDKNYLFYFAELNSNQHILTSYLKNFRNVKQFILKLKDIVIREETRAQKIYGMSINVFYACFQHLEPELFIDIIDSQFLTVLWHFAFLTKSYSCALDIFNFAVIHRVVTKQQIVELGREELFYAVVDSATKEEKGSPVKRIPSCNFYAILKFLQYSPSSLSISTGSLDDNLSSLALVQVASGFVELDHRVKYPLSNFIGDLSATLDFLKTFFASYDNNNFNMETLNLHLRKFNDLLSVILNFNYLEKNFQSRLVQWSTFETVHEVLLVMLDKIPSVLNCAAFLSYFPSSEGLEAALETKGAQLHKTLNETVTAALKLTNEIIICSPIAFKRVSELYIHNNLLHVILNSFKKQLQGSEDISAQATYPCKFILDSPDILLEISIFFSFAQYGALLTTTRIQLMDSVISVVWEQCLGLLDIYCDLCIRGGVIDGPTCRGVMTVSKSLHIISGLDHSKATESVSAASDAPANCLPNTLSYNPSLTQKILTKCFKILQSSNSGISRTGWLHIIADCIHNILNIGRFHENAPIPEIRLPESLLIACHEIPPSHQGMLLQEKSVDSWKEAADSPKDVEKLEKVRKQCEVALSQFQIEHESRKGYIQKKLSSYLPKSNSSNTGALPSSCNSSNNPYTIIPCDKLIQKDQSYIESNLEIIYVNLILCPTGFYESFGIDKKNIDNFAQMLLSICQKGLVVRTSEFDPTFIKVRNSLLATRLLSVIVAHYNIEPAIQGKICQFCIECLIQKFVILGHQSWYYQPMYSLLLILSRHDRQTKRQIVKNLGNFSYQFERAMGSQALVALLLLIDESVEFLLRIDDSGEEVVASYSLHAIQQSQFPKLQMFACKVISNVGEFHPGIIHKGVGRRETEDVLYGFLSGATKEDQHMIMSMDERYYLLKACTTCLKDVNLKPKWFSRNYLYNWRAYKHGLAERPLLQHNMASLIAKSMVSGEGFHIVPIYGQSLALSTALMYNCTDGVISTFLMSLKKGSEREGRGDNLFTTSLRDDMLSLMLVYFARALFLVTKQGKEMLDISYNHSISIVKKTARKDSKEGSFVKAPEKNQALASATSSDNVNNSRSSGPNQALELLAETTVDALFSFLCLEEMFPLSAYLRNLSTFNRVPVISSVSAIMLQFSNNLTIQKRGLDLFKSFAINNMELSSIAMHASPAIIVAIAALNSDSACQLAYCSIISSMNYADDFAIENVIRFGAHVPLFTLLTKSSNLSVCISACIGVSSIAKSGEIVDILCQELNFASAVVDFLARWPKEKSAQVEGFKALVALALSPDMSVHIFKQPGHLRQYKRTHNFIQELVKTDKLHPEYSRQDIQEMLSAVGNKKDTCTLS